MRLDYGGSSGVRTVRVDKVLAIAGRQPRRPEKERNIFLLFIITSFIFYLFIIIFIYLFLIYCT